MQVNHVDFTAAAENAAWEQTAKEQFHALGEEIIRQAAAVLLMPIDVTHIISSRIAGEVQAKCGGNRFCLRRSFADVGAELEVRVGSKTSVIRNADICNTNFVQGRVRAMALLEGIPAF